MPKLLVEARWEDVNHTTRGANALRIYGNSRFNQSKYPYYTHFFTGNEISTLMQLVVRQEHLVMVDSNLKVIETQLQELLNGNLDK